MTTHTNDESNNSMHAPDMHTEMGYILVGEGVLSSFRLTGSTPAFVFLALFCCCVTSSHPLELRVFKCNCSGRS